MLTYKGDLSEVKVTVKDGRKEDLSLDKNSFELVAQETKLTTEDFYEGAAKIKENYYPEIVKLIKESTGASEVVCWHHQVRNELKNNGNYKNLNTSVQGYAMGIHSDSCPISAEEQYLQFVSAAEYVKYRKGRFLYINAWRNISETPIGDNHLAVLDETSVVAPDDYLLSDLYGPGYHAPQYKLADRNADQHRWYYFSKMEKNEVLLFKQWDSDINLSGRVCFHTAFKDPKAPKDTPVRQSIEVRAFAFFPDHEPNTCPEFPLSESVDQDDNFIAGTKTKILQAIKGLDVWPDFAKEWAFDHYKNGEAGIVAMAHELSNDVQGHFGCRSSSKEVKKKIAEALLKDDELGKILREWGARYSKTNSKKKGATSAKSTDYLTNVVFMTAGVGIGWAACKYGKSLMQQFSSKKKK